MKDLIIKASRIAGISLLAGVVGFAVVPFAPVANAVGAPSAFTGPANNVTATSAEITGTVFPNGFTTEVWVDYGTDISSLSRRVNLSSADASAGSASVSVFVSGLTNGATYFYRISARNVAGTSQGETRNFTTTGSSSGSLPEAITGSVSSISASQALLEGEVRPNGLPTTVWFEYGTNSSLGNVAGFRDAGSGTSRFSITAMLSNLEANRNYSYRIVARNSAGTTNGNIRTFTTGSTGTGGSQTAPSAFVIPATFVTSNTARLNAKIETKGVPTQAWFEYGNTVNLGSQTVAQSVPTNSAISNFSLTAQGLQPNTRYFYRVVAANRVGASQSTLETFRTEPALPNEPPVPPAPTPTSTPPTTPPTNGTTTPEGPTPPVVGPGSGSVSCLRIDLALDSPTVVLGADYVVSATYRNDCDVHIADAELSITLPPESEFLAADFPVEDQNENVITYTLGDIAQNFQSSIMTRAMLDSGAVAGSSLVIKGDLRFVDGNGNNQLMTVFVTGIAGESSALTANILDTFQSLLGVWWFWVALILIVFFFLFWMFARRKVSEEEDEYVTSEYTEDDEE